MGWIRRRKCWIAAGREERVVMRRVANDTGGSGVRVNVAHCGEIMSGVGVVRFHPENSLYQGLSPIERLKGGRSGPIRPDRKRRPTAVSIDATNIALQGLERAQQKLERAAKRIATDTFATASTSTDLATVDPASLVESVVDLMEAAHFYEANLNMIKTDNEIKKHTLDILA